MGNTSFSFFLSVIIFLFLFGFLFSFEGIAGWCLKELISCVVKVTASQDICRDMTREDSMGRRVHLYKRFVSWVNSVLRQFLPYDPKDFSFHYKSHLLLSPC